MSEIIKPGEALSTPEQRVAVRLDQLTAQVQQLASVVGILEQHLILEKGFYDQIKVNKPEEAKKEEVKEEKKDK